MSSREEKLALLGEGSASRCQSALEPFSHTIGVHLSGYCHWFPEVLENCLNVSEHVNMMAVTVVISNLDMLGRLPLNELGYYGM